jgi:tagaturonate reductase
MIAKIEDMRLLTAELLPEISAHRDLQLPFAGYEELPEKVLQFGTGVLLRGLPDFFIDAANRQGLFNGRIVVVKSTDKGDTLEFDQQDNLYTICIRGVENGKTIEQNIICSAISRVLTAKTEWDEILAVATQPELALIISNTTEVGLRLVLEDIHESPPSSFPAKLLACLYARFQIYGADPEAGVVIIPTELIPGNGDLLKNILLELAEFNHLDTEFKEWLEYEVDCCNSLVDRIVPGKPDPATQASLAQTLGYTDELTLISESYALWAIEGGKRVKEKLSFAPAHPGVVIAESIEVFRELKLRILNGGHTISCGLAFLAGLKTVKEGMANPAFGAFMEHLLLKEIAPAIPIDLAASLAREFALQVMDRFRNPYLEHQWLSITLQYSSKMKMRDVPILLEHYTLQQEVPQAMALGFAAYLLFMKGVKKEGERIYGQVNGDFYWIQDDQAGYFFETWQQASPEELVAEVLKNTQLWGTDLTALPGFAAALEQYLNQLQSSGAAASLANFKTGMIEKTKAL